MRTASLLIAALLLAGCSKKEVPAVAEASSGATKVEEGVVVIPPDSPRLKEIHVGDVRTAPVPSDEVISPVKIEANPNLISRAALPLSGRVSAVMVKLGDSVRCGVPLITLVLQSAEDA